MRKYTMLDLIRFHKFAIENQEMKPVELVSAYNLAHPELSEEQKNKNIINGLRELFGGGKEKEAHP